MNGITSSSSRVWSERVREDEWDCKEAKCTLKIETRHVKIMPSSSSPSLRHPRASTDRPDLPACEMEPFLIF